METVWLAICLREEGEMEDSKIGYQVGSALLSIFALLQFWLLRTAYF